MKRILSLLAALALLLSGCGTAKAPTLRVGVALYDQNDTFIATVTRQLQQRFQEEEQLRDIKINLSLADGQGSQTVQNEQVDRFLDQGYDIICVNIVDRTAAAVIVDKAQTADVPVIFFNREPVEEDLRRWEGAYYVGAYAEQGGRLQGQLVLDAWREDASALDRSGDGVLQYVVLEGEAGHQDTLLRTEYSIQTLTAGGMEIEKLASATANWQRSQASARMNQWLQQYGGAMEVVFANNDDMALGAIDACLSAGLTAEEMPYIVGVDATEPALEAVKEGTLKGTVCNDAAGQAESIVALSCALLDGEDPQSAVKLEDGKYVWLPYASVTAENLADYLKTE